MIRILLILFQGEMDGGHALSMLFSHVEGDGYVNGTMFEGYNYFLGYGWESRNIISVFINYIKFQHK